MVTKSFLYARGRSQLFLFLFMHDHDLFFKISQAHISTTTQQNDGHIIQIMFFIYSYMVVDSGGTKNKINVAPIYAGRVTDRDKTQCNISLINLHILCFIY